MKSDYQGRTRNEGSRRRKGLGRKLVFGFFIFIALVMVVESPLTRVRAVQVQGNRTIPEKVILDNSGLHTGMSDWQVNGAAIQNAIKSAQPLVQSVAVHTNYMTGTVTFAVKEKHIVAALQASGQFYELLNDGTVYATLAGNSGLNWPILSTDGTLNVRVGMVPADLDVSTVCQQLSNVPDADLTSISEIHLDQYGEATTYLTNGFAVVCKPEQLTQTVDNVNDVVQYFLGKGYAPGLIDMTGSPPYRYTPFTNSSAKGGHP